MPIMEPERLQEVGSYITLDKFDKMARPFAMPAEDFPQAAPSQPLPVRFCEDIELQAGKLVISRPITLNTIISGQKLFCIFLWPLFWLLYIDVETGCESGMSSRVVTGLETRTSLGISFRTSIIPVGSPTRPHTRKVSYIPTYLCYLLV
jgi:hypothetical protein